MAMALSSKVLLTSRWARSVACQAACRGSVDLCLLSQTFVPDYGRARSQRASSTSFPAEIRGLISDKKGGVKEPAS